MSAIDKKTYFKIIKKEINNKLIILSLDLDNTLVNRKKGSNYLDPKLKRLLKKNIKK